MKLSALGHPKTLNLSALLGVTLPTVIGHLELLWAFTAEYAPQGNVGKHPNGAIAVACYWTGDPQAFIDALRESGFLDASAAHRLVVHDWEDHAAGWVRAKLKKTSQQFVSAGEPFREPSLEPTSEPTRERSLERSIQAKPSLDKPSLESESEALASSLPTTGTPENENQAPEPPPDQPPKPRTPSRGTRIPQDFDLTPERRAFATEAGISPERTMAKFRDYWLGRSGQGGTKVDWEATWRNWCRTEGERIAKFTVANGVEGQPARKWRPTEELEGAR